MLALAICSVNLQSCTALAAYKLKEFIEILMQF